MARYKKKFLTEKGNTVYEYSPRQVARRNNQKAERLEKLNKNIGKLRAQVKKDLSSGDPDKALTALVISCIDQTAERIGNESSAEDGHFGVTGWQRNHISFGKGGAMVRYVGKSGVKQKKSITDKAILRALKDAYEAAGEGEPIFQHDMGKVTAEKVNKYLSRFDVTAKDLRGFHANLTMRENLKKVRKGILPENRKEREKQLKKEWKQALERTADHVGHEASTLESQYLTPGVKDLYLKNGEVMRGMVAKLATSVVYLYLRRG
jgi:DNA topoisomerase IB